MPTKNESRSPAASTSTVRFADHSKYSIRGPNQTYKMSPVPMRRHRFRPSPEALRNTRAFPGRNLIQGPIIRELPFKQLVENALDEYRTNLRIKKSAMELLQTVAESYLVSLFENTNSMTVHSRRTSIKPKDVILARKLRGEMLGQLSYAP